MTRDIQYGHEQYNGNGVHTYPETASGQRKFGKINLFEKTVQSDCPLL